MTGAACQALDLVLLGAVAALMLRPAGWREVDVLQSTVSLRSMLVATLCVLMWRVLLFVSGMYSAARTRSLADYVLRCVVGLNSCALVLGLLITLLQVRSGAAWRQMGLFWAGGLVSLTAERLLLLVWATQVRPRLGMSRRLLIVGSGRRASQVVCELEAHAEWDYRLVGYVDSEPQGGYVPSDQVLGTIDDLERLLTEERVEEVIIALPMKSQYEAVGYSMAVCQMVGVPVQYFTDYFRSAVSRRRERRATPVRRVLVVERHRGNWWKNLGRELMRTVSGRARGTG